MSASSRPAQKFLCVLAASAATTLIAACGGASTGSSTTTSTTANAAASEHAAATATVAKTTPDKVTKGSVVHQPLRGTGGSEVNDDNPGHADQGNLPSTGRNPCKLVSQAEAQEILGKPINTPVEAPLGPTCIYRATGTSGLVTISVESINFAAVKQHILRRKRFTVAGHTAYCGTYGQLATFVPLASGQVLNVTAPCATGLRFAATALPRLAS